MQLNIIQQLNRKMGMYLMGNTYKQFIHFQNLIQNFLTPNRLPNPDLRKVELLLEECPQMVEFPSIFSSPPIHISFISMVGFSVCISSHNLIIAHFSRCVRGRPDSCFRKLILLFILIFKFKTYCGFSSASAFTSKISKWLTYN
jgi:hypothetical protein